MKVCWRCQNVNCNGSCIVGELLTEITHRLIACEQSIRSLTKQIEEDLPQIGGI